MNPANFSVRRPVTIAMMVLAVVLIGIVSFTRLKIDLIPDITFPVITVMTAYPGAGPEEVEQFVTRPIEEAVGLAKDLENIRSISRENVSVVIAEFDWGTDMDNSAFEVREKVDMVIEKLPADATRPIIVKMDPSIMMPAMLLMFSGPQGERQLRKYADDVLRRDLEKAEGVAAVSLFGGLEREILIEVDKERLDSYKIPIQQVIQIVKAENLNIPAGRLDEGKTEYIVRCMGEIRDVEKFKNISIGIAKTKPPNPIRLKDIATIKDTHKEKRSFSHINKQNCVGLMITKEAKANTVEVSDAVQKELKKIEKTLPTGSKIIISFEQAEFIKKSIHNMTAVAEEGAILAVIIIFLFLASTRSTIVIATSIPVSIITTFVLMFAFDMTLNIITLAGLTLAIGRIVDDSIVVLECIHRHIEEGEKPFEAAINGAKEVGMAVTAATLTTICVFFPIIFVGGMVKELFTPLSLVVIIGLLASLGVALTLVPMLASRLVKTPKEEKERRERRGLRVINTILHNWEVGFRKVEGMYRNALSWSLSHRSVVVLTALVIFATSIYLIRIIGMEFFPKMDIGRIMIEIETPPGTALAETEKVTNQIESIVYEMPECEFVSSLGGEQEAGPSIMMVHGAGAQTGRVMMKLVERTERDRTTWQVEDYLREKMSNIPGAIFKLSDIQKSAMGGGEAEIEIKVYGDELNLLQEVGLKIMNEVKRVPGVHDVDLNWRPGAPEYQIFIDREKAGYFGLTAGQVATTIRTLFKGDEVSKFRELGKEYDITVKAKEEDREWIEELKNLKITTPFGISVPLREVSDIKLAKGPTSISREAHLRTVIVQAAKGPRALTEIIKDIDKKITKIKFPEGYRYEYGGEEEERREAFSLMFIALIAGILLIYMILASQFESLVHPFTILMAVPMEVIGVFLALFLTGTTLTVTVMLGILMLTGIVVSNSILLVDKTNQLRDAGMQRNEAILKAGPIRLRPILMTSLSTTFALIPMALGLREGSEMFQPMGIAALGGLITSSFLTLLLVPVVYSLLDDLGEKLGLQKKKIV